MMFFEKFQLIQVIDLKTGEDLRAGKVGEILVKGPQVRCPNV